ncbi:MAG TPA: hypothetical protein VHX60_02570 [Acidobacteriaceae bacterium]|jgi:hypothetical protein|nr:hypothetical protein [Acidobacteriaceae bacterium]
MAVEPSTGSSGGAGADERSAVHEQLERLLVNPHFSHSRRFPSFLRFVVEHTLSGETDQLKERTIGIEIFGRDPDYDTSSDPIVRVTAGEIRKRIAQYYQEAGHESELRLSLPSGSYIPQFQWPNAAAVEEVVAVPFSPIPPKVVPVPAKSWIRQLIPAIALVCAALAGAATVILWQTIERPAQANGFWAPVLQSGDPVLFCIADQNQYSAITLRDAADPSKQITLRDNLTAVVIDDLSPIVRIAGILQSSGKKYSLRGEGATNLMDLRNGPTVFVGAFDNAWTLRLTKGLRYHFANNADMTEFRIVDASAPSLNRWVVNRPVQMTTNNYRDFAIIARFTDVTTGKPAIVVAGIARGGTIAAGEFLTDQGNAVQLQRVLHDAGTRNLEVVLSTQVIDGESGTPRVEATCFW